MRRVERADSIRVRYRVMVVKLGARAATFAVARAATVAVAVEVAFDVDPR